ncbi:unnamed protein product, partial [marine sediment metagenome]
MKGKLLKLLSAIGLVVVIVALLMAGCAKPAPAPTPTPTTEQEVITWVFQSNVPAGNVWYDLLCSDWAANIETVSGGRFVIEMNPAGAICASGKGVEGADDGIIDIGDICPAFCLDRVPTASLFSCIVGGMAPITLDAWFSQGGGKDLLDRAFSVYPNVLFLDPPTVYPVGEVWAFSTVPISSLSDIDGLKMRCLGDGGEILKKMGASTI